MEASTNHRRGTAPIVGECRLCKIEAAGGPSLRLSVDVELIKKYWNDYVRILASIGRGVTSVVLLSQRLSSYADQNPLYKVIREIGRIVKTRHILRTYDDPDFRRRVNAGLDRIENFNCLARHMFFARRGENWERDFEEQLNRATSLMILANACVL